MIPLKPLVFQLILLAKESLSPPAQRMLQSAAVIGTRFGFGLLRRLVEDLPEDQLFTALDLANRLGRVSLTRKRLAASAWR